MIIIFLVLLGIWVAISLIIYNVFDKKIHGIFPIHFSLAIVTILICCYWFLSENEFMFDYGPIWSYIEKGSLEALSETMKIIGIGSVLLSWTYGERDKLTLGKKQADMVRYLFGPGYTTSFMTHISSAVLCLIMLKSNAREASLWTFVTVLWGCISQVCICLIITLNSEQREKIALKLWEKDNDKEDNFQVIQNMAEYLSDAHIRNNKKYLAMMGKIICAQLCTSCNNTNDSQVFSSKQFEKVSRIFHEITAHILPQDREIFEENIFQIVCHQLYPSKSADVHSLVLFSFGYYRFLYIYNKKDIPSQIRRIAYYSQTQDEALNLFGELSQECHQALKWYRFTDQRVSIPSYTNTFQLKEKYIELAFQNLILSLFEETTPHTQEIAKYAWDQIHSEREQQC